jgi:hypothetical protein
MGGPRTGEKSRQLTICTAKHFWATITLVLPSRIGSNHRETASNPRHVRSFARAMMQVLDTSTWDVADT